MPPELCIVIEFDDNTFEAAGLQLHEAGKWKQSQYPDLLFRVDPARPELKVKRHVTIAHKKHLTAKNKQVSWSDDATRHDKKTFDVNFQGFNKAHDIARTVLKLPPNVQLEAVAELERLRGLVESASGKAWCESIGYARADILLRARRTATQSGDQKLFDLLD